MINWLRKRRPDTPLEERVQASAAANEVRRQLTERAPEVNDLSMFAQERLERNHIAESIRQTIETATRRTA